MLKLFWVAMSLVLSLNAHQLQSVQLQLDQSFDSYGTVTTDVQIPIGSSGIVWQEISKDVSSVIARVIVSQKTQSGYELAYRVFDDLAQEALPYPKLRPKEGDVVLLNYLYNRVVPIVPSLQAYEVALQKYPDIDFVQPELFAAYLAKEAAAVPNRDDFTDFCKQSNASLIYFALNDGGRFVDCFSLYTVAKDRVMYGVRQPMAPFYSKINSIEPSVASSIFEMIKSIEIPLINEKEQISAPRKSSLGNFYSYYKSIIRK